jgi:hypothetical protein
LESLIRILGASIKRNKFVFSDFFQSWVREEGAAYFFLFKKNLQTTNIQYAELASLIRQNTARKKTQERVPDVAFHTTARFRRTIEAIVAPVLERSGADQPRLGHIAELYWPLVDTSMILDIFYTSCALFVPPHLSVDLLEVCANSGYVHSCGPAVFIRKVAKATPRDFYSALAKYLRAHTLKGEKLFFIPYSHEDFSGYDSEVKYVRDELKHGLDEVKLRVEKLHMGQSSIPEVLSEVRRRFERRLVIPEAGDYRVKHPATNERTLWLVCDRSIDARNPTTPGQEEYYICYDQILFNDSPFHIFDENKPAWVEHTTIPHTLLGAMLNVTRPWDAVRQTIVADPFAGTGTTWLEGLKCSSADLRCSDNAPISPLLLRDNLEFFGLTSEAIRAMAGALAVLAAEVGKSADGSLARKAERYLFPELDTRAAYDFAVTFLEKLGVQDARSSFSFDDAAVGRLGRQDLFTRIVFYIVLRAEIRFREAFERKAKNRAQAFVESARDLQEQMEHLAKWKVRAESAITRQGHISVFPGRYSRACGIAAGRLREAMDEGRELQGIEVRDARFLEPKSCDVIVTDPPYGFNTESELLGLALLYSEVARTLVRAVSNNGHLVICLPIRSHTGRPLPFCTHSSIVTGQVLRSAESCGRSVYVPASSSAEVLSPPYYWESPALRRIILHFRIRDR